MTDIHVRTFTGSSLKPYAHGIAKLRTEVFREYPYLEEPDFVKETQHLNKVLACKESIGVLIFDNATLVGASLGYPLRLEEPTTLKTFPEKQIPSYFFFGDSVLLKTYRGRGIGHHFFDAREAHVHSLKPYQSICFYFPDDIELDPTLPKDFVPLFDFWRKRGYIHHPELKCLIPWRKIAEAKPKERQCSFWIKNLNLSQ